jgi:hypothetical protein
MDNNAPRGHWPLDRVIEVLPGKNGRLHIVKVKKNPHIFAIVILEQTNLLLEFKERD